MPFEIYSSSVNAGYAAEMSSALGTDPGFSIENLHEDTYAGIKDAPMQGPFTYQYVGGNQHRHVPLNKGSDTIFTRPELFYTNLSSSGEIKVIGSSNSSIISGTIATPPEVLVDSTPSAGPLADPQEVALDLSNSQMYWTDYTLDAIKRSSLDGTNVEVILQFGSVAPSGIALDLDARMMYWNDTTTDSLYRATMDGRNIEFLYNQPGNSVPKSIALDPAAGMMYWTNAGNVDYDNITRAPMDGTGPIVELIGSDYITWPNGIALDIDAGMMYFTDAVGTGPGKVGRAPMDGTGSFAPENLIDGHLTRVYPKNIALDLDARMMYYDNTVVVDNPFSIIRAPMDGTASQSPETVISSSDSTRGLALDTNLSVKQFGQLQAYWFRVDTTGAGLDSLRRTTVDPRLPTTAQYTRGLVAKRPVNIANHKTYNPLGNFTYDYEVVQTVGRTSNNRAFVEAEGAGFIGDPSLPYSGSLITQFVSGARDPLTGTTLPAFLREETVFVNRFNAPGGPDVSSRGVLDTYAEEFAPNNALPWRNNAVRSVLRSDLTRHTPKATSIPDSPTLYALSVLDVPQAIVSRIYYTSNAPDQIGYRQKIGPSTWGDPVAISNTTTDYANGIAIDNLNKKVYWTEWKSTNEHVAYANLDGSEETIIVAPGGTTGDDIRGIAVSPYLNKIAWCTRKNVNTISTASLDGTDWGVAISGLNDPYDVVIDDKSNKMYWVGAAESTGSERIWSASLDGTGYGPLSSDIQDFLVQDEHYGITGLDLDRLNDKLYIIGDYHADIDTRIYSCSLDGTDAALVVQDLAISSQPIDIKVDPWGNRIYWSYYHNDVGIYSCSLDNPGTSSVNNLFGQAFSTSTGGSSYVKMGVYFEGVNPPCEPTPTKYHTDNRNTRYYKQTPPQDSIQDLVATGAGTVRVVALDTWAGQMYWNDSTAGKIFRATLDGGGVEELVTGLSNVQGMALDTCAEKMYWTDSDDDKIQRANLDGTVVENVITSLNFPISIALDIDAGQMYWTDLSGGKIKRAAMALGASVEELITGLTYPNGIALDTGARKMYWVDQTGVKKANIDGTEIEFVFEHTFIGTSAARLALDTSLGKVYWTDTTLDKIQRANLDGTEVEDLITGLPHPDGIALDISAGKMYWTDANDDKIQRANMPEKPLYDNGYVTHAIPQCSLQYAWIKASAITDRTQLQGYQTSGSY